MGEDEVCTQQQECSDTSMLSVDASDKNVIKENPGRSIDGKNHGLGEDEGLSQQQPRSEGSFMANVDDFTKRTLRENPNPIDEKTGCDDKNIESNEACSPQKPPTEESDSDAENDNGLSEYEKYRLENIKRNNARLRALGLLKEEPNSLEQRAKLGGSRKRRKVDGNAMMKLSMPTRRSTRIQKSTSSSNDEIILGESVKIQEQPMPRVIEKEWKEEFTVSPLVDYYVNAEGSQSKLNKVKSTDEKIDHSLIITDQRLMPPKGLNAVYSLNFQDQLLVGAGKAGLISIWEWQSQKENEACEKHPLLSWKSHAGRWIAEALIVCQRSRLITAANDGCVCLWDTQQVSVQTGCPKLLHRTDKALHTSGIFAMDVRKEDSRNSDLLIATGSKDKTVAVFSLAEGTRIVNRWDHHTAKVGGVRWQGRGSSMLGTASDDGTVAIVDFRMDHNPVAALENVHIKPHSMIWNPSDEHVFVTAGLDHVIKLWDLRRMKQPTSLLQGHVPSNLGRCRRITRPQFFGSSHILTGGEGSSALSMYDDSGCLESRGRLHDGDAGCIAVQGEKVAISVQDGQVLLLQPRGKIN